MHLHLNLTPSDWASYPQDGLGHLEQNVKSSSLIMQFLRNKGTLKRFFSQEIDDERLLGVRDCDALRVAARLGLETITRKLFDVGVAVDILDWKAQAALHYAANSGQDRIVDVLLGAGAKINRQNCNGELPLMKAILGGRFSTVHLLPSNNAKANVEDKFGI